MAIFYKAVDCLVSQNIGTVSFESPQIIGANFSVTDGEFTYCIRLGIETDGPATLTVVSEYNNCFECLNGENVNISVNECFNEQNYIIPISAFTSENQLINNGDTAISYVCMSGSEQNFCVCASFSQSTEIETETVISITGPYGTCEFCLEVNTPRSANTEVFICEVCCECGATGTTVNQIAPPHPVWTDGYGTPVTQLNMVTLGGMKGLNN